MYFEADKKDYEVSKMKGFLHPPPTTTAYIEKSKNQVLAKLPKIP